MSLSESWQREARHWIEWARTPGHDSYWRFHRDQFFTLLPAPDRLTLDIGCGEGRLPRDLKQLGHRVTGIDVSTELLEAARQLDPDGHYLCANAARLPVIDGVCDLAVAFMSLHDVDDLTSAVGEMARVLIDGGVACIAIVHPLNSAGAFHNNGSTPSPFVIRGTYLDEFGYSSKESRDGLHMTFHSQHRPLQAYSRALEAAGLVIEAIREHAVPDEAVASERQSRWQRIPLFLHIRARKLKTKSAL
jgi:SAM-dependent methyltransferase